MNLVEKICASNIYIYIYIYMWLKVKIRLNDTIKNKNMPEGILFSSNLTNLLTYYLFIIERVVTTYSIC